MLYRMSNIAFIDGQNLYMGTTKSEPTWEIDLARFRVYLKEKYSITEAYYFLGCIQEGDIYTRLYNRIQLAGFVLQFRQHTSAMVGAKKGNVDTDIVFSIMRRLYKKNDFDSIFLISGDGDYKGVVDFLIEEKKFGKILFPNKRYASSLYKKLGAPYFAYLSAQDTKEKIQANEKGSLGN
jgi:uncharacterized LabA/DUF88 family protein